MEKKPRKKTRDVNELAKGILDAATGEDGGFIEPKKDPTAVARGRKGGVIGGKARANKLSAEQRIESAKKAAKSRWKRMEG